MLHYLELNYRCLALTLAVAGMPLIASHAYADSVPESIRIQQQAEKAYETHPVVPIERGNAHHRDAGKEDGGDGVGGTSVPNPPPAREPATRHDSNN